MSAFSIASGSSSEPSPPSLGTGITCPTGPPASSPSRVSKFAASVPVDRAHPSGEIPYQGRAESTAYRQWRTAAAGTNSVRFPDGPKRSHRYHHSRSRGPPRTSHERDRLKAHRAPLDHDLVNILAPAYQIPGNERHARRRERRSGIGRGDGRRDERAAVQRYSGLQGGDRRSVTDGLPGRLRGERGHHGIGEWYGLAPLRLALAERPHHPIAPARRTFQGASNPPAPQLRHAFAWFTVHSTVFESIPSVLTAP